LLLIGLTCDGFAQQRNRSSRTSPQERIARARWEPVRNQDPSSTPRTGPVRPIANVRTAQATEPLPAPRNEQSRRTPLEPIPTPQQDGLSMVPGEFYGGSVIEGPFLEGPMPADAFGGPVACDAMLCHGGDCGGCGGVGCDTGVLCDSPGIGVGSPRCGRRHGWWPCLTLCLPRDGWVAVDSLHWTQRGMHLPPLVSRGTTFNTNPVLGDPNVSVAYGGADDYLEDDMNGVRLNFGFWLDHCHEWSLSADYFEFGSVSDSAQFVGVNGGPSLGRPFFDIALGNVANAVPVNYAGLDLNEIPVDVTGVVGIQASSELVSGGFQLRRFLVCRDGCGDTIFYRLPAQFRSRIDLGIGYRYTELDENLLVNHSVRGNAAQAPLSFNASDSFITQTRFNGFDFGIYYTRMRGRWNFDMQGRFAIGVNRQEVDIDGRFTRNAVSGAGGLLAQPSNIGARSRDRMSVLPEFRATLGYRLTPRLRFNVGYTFLYWSNVVRPGDHIDLDINGNQIGTGGYTATRPEFAYRETDFWAHGVSFGGDYRW
jgi:hypothetical protein